MLGRLGAYFLYILALFGIFLLLIIYLGHGSINEPFGITLLMFEGLDMMITAQGSAMAGSGFDNRWMRPILNADSWKILFIFSASCYLLARGIIYIIEHNRPRFRFHFRR